MPNHCWNSLTVIGHEEDIRALCESEFKFAHLLPIPEHGADQDWCVKNWGTKWERWDYETTYRDTNECSVTFTTAWNPPFEYLRYILERYPRCWMKLTFSIEAHQAGIWIAYKWKGAAVEKKMFWEEPMAALTRDGEIYIPHREDETS